jgi:hypothetical protein
MSERQILAEKLKLAGFLVLAIVDTVILIRWPT